MTWLIEGFPYWICHSCGLPPMYKPKDCDEQKHSRYYRRKLKSKRVGNGVNEVLPTVHNIQ